jgi:DNA-binding MarR family transcriptional regulator
VLGGDLVRALHGVALPSGISASTGASPAVLDHLPAAIRDGYISGYAQALHTVFLFAAPVGALAFCLTFLLKEVPLRDTTRAVDRADSTAPTAIPAARDSAQEMERALLTLLGREHRAEVYRRLAAAAGVQVSPRGCWLLYRVADNAPITEAALARLLGITVADLQERMAELVTAGYVTAAAAANPTSGDDARVGASVALTPVGQQAAARLDEAREAGIDRLMTGWEPDRNPELRQLLGRITRTLVATDNPPQRDTAAAATATSEN